MREVKRVLFCSLWADKYGYYAMCDGWTRYNAWFDNDEDAVAWFDSLEW